MKVCCQGLVNGCCLAFFQRPNFWGWTGLEVLAGPGNHEENTGQQREGGTFNKDNSSVNGEETAEGHKNREER